MLENKKKTDIINDIKKEKLIVIVRGVPTDKLCDLLEAMYRGGVRLAEITFDSKGKVTDEQTAETIEAMSAYFCGRMRIGAGTVTNLRRAMLASEAGAQFLISPNTSEEVIRYAAAKGVASISGAMTPTEIVTAYETGADFVKLFPSDSLGIKYIKAVSAPLSNIPLLAVGGVNEDNLGDFLDTGICGVGIGSNITKKSLIEAGDWDGIAALAGRYCDIIKAYGEKKC